jgi:hypothetical protein
LFTTISPIVSVILLAAQLGLAEVNADASTVSPLGAAATALRKVPALPSSLQLVTSVVAHTVHEDNASTTAIPATMGLRESE